MRKAVASIVISLLIAAPASAQAPASTPARPATSAAAEVPLRVQLVVARSMGEKKVSSVPYTLSVVANDNDKTSMRMGVDVPIPLQIINQGSNASAASASYNYRSVGTNIDCTARTVEGGLFKLDLAVTDSTVFMPEKQAAAPGVAGIPAFRSFTSTFNVLLKDGQTVQHIAATDPVSGEVLRIEVTVNVVK